MDPKIYFEDICLSSSVADPTDGRFDMDVLSARIADTDSLVQSFHLQSQEIEELRAQLVSLNESAMRVNASFLDEQRKSTRLQRELNEATANAKRVEQKLEELSNEQINAASIHKQVVADLENQQTQHDVELIGLCKQFLVQGNVLADNHLSDGAMNRTYMKVVEMLKRKGESVEGLLKTTSSKRKKSKVSNASTMTSHVACSVSTMTEPKKTFSSSSMTDDLPPSLPITPAKTFCDRATQHLPTTTTRGTTTSVFIQKVSIGTNFPEPVPLTEIFRQTIIDIPAPISPILDFQWPKTDTGCQTMDHESTTTTDAAIVVDLPAKPTPKVHSVGTMTQLSNVRKSIDYTRQINRRLILNGRHPLGAIYDIKKEDPSPTSSLQNLAAMGHDAPVHPVLGPQSPISPHLSGLWRILGQTIFSIIGTGRIFDNSPSTMEMINANLDQIRSVVESGQQLDEFETIGDDGERELETMDGFAVDELDGRFECDKNRAVEVADAVKDGDEELDHCVEGNLHANPEPAPPPDETPPINEPSPPVAIFAIPEIPKIRVPYKNQTAPSSSQQSHHSLAAPSPQMAAETTTTKHMLPPNNNDAAIFKVPTSAVRRMSARQRAMVQHCKKPIISPPSYSIDRNFKRAKRKPKMSIVELQQQQQHRFPDSPRRAAPVEEHKVEAVPVEEKLDLTTITKYFNIPQLIEPIMDLNIDMILFGLSDSDEDDDDDLDQRAGEQCSAHPTNQPEVQSSIADNADGTSPSDTCSSALVSSEHSATTTNESASNSMLSELLEISSSSESEDDEEDAIREPSVKKLKLSESVDEFDSPASPPSDDQGITNDEPIRIPLDTYCAKQQPLLSNILKNAKWRAPRKPITGPIENAHSALYYKAFKIVTHYLEAPNYTDDEVVQCTTRLLHVSRSPRLIATCILELVEHIDQELDTALSPPSPALTDSHKRIVLLVNRLQVWIPQFSKYCQLLAERTLFTLTKNDMPLAALVNCVRFFVALHDLRATDNTSRIRVFIYKCLYYYQHTSTPIVYAVLMAHPDCLPLLPETVLVGQFPVADFSTLDPLVQTVYTILMNTACPTDEMKKVAQSHLYKKNEMLVLLRSYYRYTGTRYRFDELLQHLLQRLHDNRLENVGYALVLVAKRKGWQWANQHLLDAPLLPQLLRQLVPLTAQHQQHDDQIACVLFVIAAVVKTMPLTEPVKPFQELFAWVLDNTPADRPVLQEAAISALLLTARFGMIDVFNRIRHWIPDFRISRKLHTQLKSFVGRKPIAFWK